LENLSPELIRNFKLIQDLDSRVRDILIEIDNLKENYLKNFKSYDQETRLTKIKDIEDKYEKSKQFSDEKVQLANKTYELIDAYICKLDTDLGRFEGEFNLATTSKDDKPQPVQLGLNVSNTASTNDETLGSLLFSIIQLSSI
jgi:inhibitor of growth protein 5